MSDAARWLDSKWDRILNHASPLSFSSVRLGRVPLVFLCDQLHPFTGSEEAVPWGHSN